MTPDAFPPAQPRPDAEAIAARLRAGVQAHERGDLDAAAAAYRAVLEADPRHPDATHLSGVVMQQRGDAARALERLRSAAALAPDHTPYRANLAVALRASGDLPGALEQLREAAPLDPRHHPARRNLGLVLAEAGLREEAAAHLRAALEIAPDDAPALRAAGLAALMLGRNAEAVNTLERALALAPNDAPTLNRTGVALRRVGRTAEACARLEQALERGGRTADVLTNYGDALSAAGRHEEAVAALREAIGKDGGLAEAHNNLAVALEALARFDEAAVALRRALAIAPDYTPALNNLGNDLLRRGMVAEAEARFLRVVELEPRHVPAWYALAANTRHRFSADERRALEALAQDAATPPAARGLLRFGLANALDRAGDADAAFAHAAAANRWRRDAFLRAGTAFDRAAHSRRVDALIAAFPPGVSIPSSGEISEVPVFIVGMPRSGTTLVEQILAAHPGVVAGGETDDITTLSEKLLPGDPRALLGLSPGALAHAAAEQLGRYGAPGRGAARVTDKTTVNFLALHLIAALFPQARVIHCVRDARDTCLSCYFHNFASPGMAFAFDLADLGSFYRDYERLMRHWGLVLALRRFDVIYEDLVAEPERWARALVDFCGLSWDPACMEFHRSCRVVKTASAIQVREPVHRRAVGRLRKYAAHLGPLSEALEGRAPEAPADAAAADAMGEAFGVVS